MFVAYEPLAGNRFTQVRVQRTRRDWAEFMREVLDRHYPSAEKVVLVMDNLNTHGPASFYEVFPPAEARRLARKLEIHYTPKHGSWLNMAEIERSRVEPAMPLPTLEFFGGSYTKAARRGRTIATRIKRKSTGALPLTTLASSSNVSTRHKKFD